MDNDKHLARAGRTLQAQLQNDDATKGAMNKFNEPLHGPYPYCSLLLQRGRDREGIIPLPASRECP
jgi:hypothetical protein